MDEGSLLLTARRYYRRLYTSGGELVLASLTAAADALVTAGAFDEVVLTSHQFEGGGASGQVMFPKHIRLQVLEELIAEADPTLPREVTQTQAVFRTSTTTTSEA